MFLLICYTCFIFLAFVCFPVCFIGSVVVFSVKFLKFYVKFVFLFVLLVQLLFFAVKVHDHGFRFIKGGKINRDLTIKLFLHCKL